MTEQRDALAEAKEDERILALSQQINNLADDRANRQYLFGYSIATELMCKIVQGSESLEQAIAHLEFQAKCVRNMQKR